MLPRPTVAILSGSYPYDGEAENTFLDPEVAHLEAAFAQVLLVPGALKGTRRPTPGDLRVDERLASRRRAPLARARALAAAVAAPILFPELAYALKQRSPALMRRIVAALANAQAVYAWGVCRFASGELDPRRTVLYTYWFDSYTAGLALLKRRYPELRIVSRAHNFDVYAERQSPPFMPFREFTVRYLDRLYPISSDGRDYIAARYPAIVGKSEVARLGVAAPSSTTARSADGVFRVVSCSYLAPVKRVDLLMEGVVAAARRRPEARFEWTHVGGGERLAWFRGQADPRQLPPNLTVRFVGSMVNDDVMRLLRENSFDTFVNVSAFEGIPVSIMEAQSQAIPVIATRVGGTGEIVDADNGVLLGPDPGPADIADALLELQGNPALLDSKKASSQRSFRERYCADRNFAQFARSLRDLRDAG